MSTQTVLHSPTPSMDRIIWAEDNAMIRLDAQEMFFSMFGIPEENLLWPVNGDELVELARENYTKCPIIFTDNSMPHRGDGIRAVREIRKFYLPPRPIFLVSGDINPLNSRSVDYADVLRAGVTDCILKPYRTSAIEKLLNKYCPHLIFSRNE